MLKKFAVGLGAILLAVAPPALAADLSGGGASAQQLDYVPLPATVKTAMRAAWAADVKAGDEPVFAAK